MTPKASLFRRASGAGMIGARRSSEGSLHALVTEAPAMKRPVQFKDYVQINLSFFLLGSESYRVGSDREARNVDD
jgi:hypothetical protein